MRISLVIVAAALAGLLAAAAGVYAYDQGRDDRIADGVRVGGFDVGGLSAAEARERLRAQLLEPLAQPVTVRSRGFRFHLTAREARTAVDVEASVAEAVARSREGTMLSRTFRALTGTDLDAAVEPRVTYSSEAVGRLVGRVARRIDRPAQDAELEFAATGLERRRERVGLQLDRRWLRDRVEAALVMPGAADRLITARVRKTQPEVTRSELADRHGTVLTVDRAGFQLRLYKRLKLVKSYPIAVGQVGLETPPGLYDIQNKAIDPAWSVPYSDWAGDLAGTVVPGGVPENPLKARWLGIYNGVGIHGTAERASIGSNASHGCIRMLVEDVTDLYDRVPVGADVYIA
jgi:hypothetical protein